MKVVRAVLAGALAVRFVAADYSPEALKDEVHGLPGAPSVAWRMFSGYIDVSASDEAQGTRQMFYWFVESQSSPAKDPVMLWTNGGPGCSGMSGFLSEQGPFRAGVDGKELEVNDFAWNKLANMVFIEQPVGVGFSYTSKDLDYGDSQAAADNHRFVLGFFKRYSQYAAQDFYISSESYGGHYMPTLAQKLRQAADVPQFRGVFLGNPLSYMPYRNYGQYGTAWGHQLLPAPLWKRYEGANCATTFPPTAACNNITGEMDHILSGFDPYALDFDKCSTGASVGRHERWMMYKTILRANAHAVGKESLLGAGPYQPCIEDFMTKYMNRPEVQAAIHAKPGTNWGMCSDVVGNKFNINDVNAPMMPIWQELIDQGGLNIMIYSGDDDSVCATLGTQQFVWDLGYASQADKTWQAWMANGQVGGFKTDFQTPSQDGRGSFSFVTVHGAGHMVPATQPLRSLELLRLFLAEAGRGQPKLSLVV